MYEAREILGHEKRYSLIGNFLCWFFYIYHRQHSTIVNQANSVLGKSTGNPQVAARGSRTWKRSSRARTFKRQRCSYALHNKLYVKLKIFTTKRFSHAHQWQGTYPQFLVKSVSNYLGVLAYTKYSNIKYEETAQNRRKAAFLEKKNAITWFSGTCQRWGRLFVQ